MPTALIAPPVTMLPAVTVPVMPTALVVLLNVKPGLPANKSLSLNWTWVLAPPASMFPVMLPTKLPIKLGATMLPVLLTVPFINKPLGVNTATLAVPATVTVILALANAVILVLPLLMLLTVILLIPPPLPTKFWAYTVFQRNTGAPKLRTRSWSGITWALAMTLPIPLGFSTKLPLVFKVRMVFWSIWILEPTGPAAQIWSKFTLTASNAWFNGSPGATVGIICCPPWLKVAVMLPEPLAKA